MNLAAAHRPKAPSTCTHALAGRARSQIALEVVAGPGVDVARLGADDGRHRTTFSCLQRPGEGVDRQGAVGVRRQLNHRGPAQPEQPQRGVNAGVALLAGKDPDGRRTGQPPLFNVPADPLEHAVPSGRQPDRVGARSAGHQSKRGGFGQPEQVL